MARLSARTAAGPSSARIFFSRPARAHPNLSSVADDGMSDLEHHHEDDQDGKVALRGIVVAASPSRTPPLAIRGFLRPKRVRVRSARLFNRVVAIVLAIEPAAASVA